MRFGSATNARSDGIPCIRKPTRCSLRVSDFGSEACPRTQDGGAGKRSGTTSKTKAIHVVADPMKKKAVDNGRSGGGGKGLVIR
ncbi:hypothetical protein Tco_1392337 [Tanacetum coccineum]